MSKGKAPTSAMRLSSIILGGGVFGSQYNDQEYLDSSTPAQVIKKALDSGINAIDTSPFYGTSESIIGAALSSSLISSKYPRSSYFLATKCGRYGANAWAFDYSPERVRASVLESLKRFKTEYLDIVYLHDVEFVADAVFPNDDDEHSARKSGENGYYPRDAIKPENLTLYGLDGASEGRVVGDGDTKVILAYKALIALQSEGVIKKVGIAGYPLPTLLRLARLLRQQFRKPVDVVQTYSHYNLQNTALEAYVPHFRAAGVLLLTNASPLNMGLLTSSGPPYWHLAPPVLRQACVEAHRQLSHPPDDEAVKETEWKATTIEDVALGFGLGLAGRSAVSNGNGEEASAKSQHGEEQGNEMSIHTVIGCSLPSHVDSAIGISQSLYAPTIGDQSKDNDLKRKEQAENETLVMDLLKASGSFDWSWESPPAFPEAERNA